MRINRDWTEDWGGQAGPADHSPDQPHHTTTPTVWWSGPAQHTTTPRVMVWWTSHTTHSPTTRTSLTGKNTARKQEKNGQNLVWKKLEKKCGFTQFEKPVWWFCDVAGVWVVGVVVSYGCDGGSGVAGLNSAVKWTDRPEGPLSHNRNLNESIENGDF